MSLSPILQHSILFRTSLVDALTTIVESMRLLPSVFLAKKKTFNVHTYSFDG
jgi:hypothetical protein